MTIHRLVAAAVAALALLTAASAVGAAAAPSADGAAAKKRCHFVKKKVHGKIKRVRVCTKPKPKPKPPRNVNVALNTAAQAKATVGAGGGEVSGQAGAARVTLSVPAGALAADTQVTLTPVSSVRGLPKGLKVLAGVQFGPENLALDKPATLTIAGVTGSGVHAIAWIGLGRDVSRYPSARSGDSITLRVSHFSGVAVVSGPGWSTLRSPDAALRARFASEIKPRLDRAASEDPLESGTFAEAFAWEREVELLGLGDEFAAEKAQIRAALTTAIQNAIGRAATACSSGHDLTQVERLTRLDRIAQLFGISVSGGSGFERAVKCAHFELDGTFRITADYHVHDDNGSCVNDQVRQFELGVELKGAPLAFSGGGGAIAGEAPVVVTKYAYTETVDTACKGSPPFHCVINGISASSERNVQLKLEIDTEGIATRGHPLVTLTIIPGAVTQTYSNCFGGPPAGGPTDVFTLFPADKGLPPTTAYVVSLSEPPHGHFVGGDVYATYGPETVEGMASIQHYTMTRSFTLRHVPAA